MTAGRPTCGVSAATGEDRGLHTTIDSAEKPTHGLGLFLFRQKVDDFSNGVISFARSILQFAVYREFWVWLSVKQAVCQRATDPLVEKDQHNGDF